ncbi:MAG: c-type cytochrome, partial [Akkermansiaceae bacterium]
MKAIATVFSICLTAGSLWAAPHPGKAPYEPYCGACHAPDGKGIAGGQFPPLAGSEWVGGKPERMIELVLHG